jgi:excisionase family DNA binding protein
VIKEARFYSNQAEECRELARRTDQIGRRLIEMADECDDRARNVESAINERPSGIKLSPLPQRSSEIEPLTRSIKDAGKLLGLSRTTIYRLIGEGQLETVRIGNRTLIKSASIRSLVEIPSE